MEKSFRLKDLDDLPDVAEQLKRLILDEESDGASPCTIVLFHGEMGAGKTTLIKEICSQMNVMDTVTSPTFALINEYNTETGRPVYHFDFYRIGSLEEVFDLGYEEYFYSGNLCLIEWPEKIAGLLPEKGSGELKIAWVSIEVIDKNARRVTFSDGQ